MKISRALGVAFAALLLAPLASLALTDIWDGNGGVGANDNFNNGLNWQDDTAPASDLVNTDLIFATTNKLTPNVSVAFAADSITFDNTAGAFVFGGQPLSVGTTGIINNDLQPMTFNTEVKFDGVANSTINAAAGDLIFTNTVTLPTSTLTVTGGDGTSFADIAGASALTKSGAATMTWTPTLATSCDITVSAGTLTMGADGGTDVFNSTSTIAVNGTSVFNINESLTLEGQLTRATGADLNIAGGKTLTVQNGGDVTITGNFAPGSAGTMTVTGAGSTFSTGGVLDLNGGSTTNVLAGASYTSGAMRVGNTTNATLAADGSGSTLSGTSLNVGLIGATGSVTLTNGASGTFSGAIDVDNSGSAGTNGTLSIQSGSSVSGTGLFLAASAAANTGTVTITGTNSALTVTGAGTTTIGAASASSGTLNVNSSGTYNSGTGLTTVNATGTIAINGGTYNSSGSLTLNGDLNVQSSGTFSSSTGLTTVNATGTIAIGGGTYNSNGNLTLDGGQLTRSNTGALSIDPGTTLTVQAGGDATITGAFANTTASTIAVTGAGSTFSTTGALSLDGGSTTNVLAGGDLSSGAANLTIGGTGNGTVVVDGVGSSLGGGPTAVGGTGNSGSLTFSNSSTGTLGLTRVAFSLVANTSGALEILSGADVTCTGFGIAELAGSNVLGTVTINGSGSSLTLSGGPIFNIGAAANSMGTLNVQSGGSFAVTTGTMQVQATGTIAITGGTYNSSGADLILNGGQLTRDTGTFTLGAGRELRVQGGGDAIFTGSYNNGTTSTIIVTGAGSTLSTTTTLQFHGGSTVNVTNGADLISGSSISIGTTGIGTVTVNGSGSTFGGLGLVLGGSVGTSSLTFTNDSAGTFTSLSLVPVAAAGAIGTLSIESGADVTATSLSVAQISGATTGTITVTGAGSTLTLTGATASSIGGASASSGNVTVESGGTFTTSIAPVLVSATGTLNINAGGTLTGPADFGGTGAVNIAGAYLPGTASGANQTTEASFAHNITLQPTTSITMEIGGLAAGIEHDRIAFNGPGTPHITWNGTLNVVLINGFVPQGGQSFDLFNFDINRGTGAFTTINLPALPAGLFWRTNALYNLGQVHVSSVPATFAEWESAFGVTGGFDGDDDLDGVQNGIEFLLGTNPKMAFGAGQYPLVELPPTHFETHTEAHVQFHRPSLPANDARYRLYASFDLVNWDLIASKDGNGLWSVFLTAEVAEGSELSGYVPVTVTEFLGVGAPRFHRLEAAAP